MNELIEQFRNDAEDFQEPHIGHDYMINDNAVTFEGDWEASHEAWLFKQWLESEDYDAIFADQNKKSVIIVEGVDVPDWIDVGFIDRDEVKLQAMSVSVVSTVDNLDDAVDRLKTKMWNDLRNVSGVGSKSIARLMSEFETPLHGLAKFHEVEGIGPSTAESLNSFVMLGGNEL